jgi:predicted transcriptional regulator
MTALLPKGSSRRERQIMRILYERGQATVADVQEALPDPPGYSAVRRLMAILEEKGQVRHTEQAGRYVYIPAEPWTSVSRSALEQVVEIFSGGSVEQAVATLLSSRKTRPTEEQLQKLEALIRRVAAEETTEPFKEDTSQEEAGK